MIVGLMGNVFNYVFFVTCVCLNLICFWIIFLVLVAYCSYSATIILPLIFTTTQILTTTEPYITGFWAGIRRWILLVEQELHTLKHHRSPSLVLVGFMFLWSLVFCVGFVDHSLSFWPLHCWSFTDYMVSDCPFGIFKPFLYSSSCCSSYTTFLVM